MPGRQSSDRTSAHVRSDASLCAASMMSALRTCPRDRQWETWKTAVRGAGPPACDAARSRAWGKTGVCGGPREGAGTWQHLLQELMEAGREPGLGLQVFVRECAGALSAGNPDTPHSVSVAGHAVVVAQQADVHVADVAVVPLHLVCQLRTPEVQLAQLAVPHSPHPRKSVKATTSDSDACRGCRSAAICRQRAVKTKPRAITWDECTTDYVNKSERSFLMVQNFVVIPQVEHSYVEGEVLRKGRDSAIMGSSLQQSRAHSAIMGSSLQQPRAGPPSLGQPSPPTYY